MKLDVYSYVIEEVKQDENTSTEKSIRKNYSNLTLEEAKAKVNEIFDSVSESATGLFISIDKSYNEQMDMALKSM